MATRTAVLDRTLPHSKAAEMAVLGAMLFDPRAIGQVLELLSPDSFYFEHHRTIFTAILALYEANHQADLVTLSERLKQDGRLEAAGGNTYLAELGESVPAATHVLEYADIVRKKALLRGLVDVAQEIVADAMSDSGEAEEIVDRAESRIFEIAEHTVEGGLTPLTNLLVDSFEYIDQLHKSKRKITGIATGFHDMDEMLTGLQPSDLVIIAARPSMGKTSFALNIAEHVAVEEGKGVALFSLEMAKRQLVLRLLASEARIPLRRLQTGYFGEEHYAELVRASGRLSHSPIYIDDTPAISALDVRAKARRLRAQGKLDLLVIDYLQLMHERGRIENRQQEIAKISRSLKSLARELNVPVIALSQLSRAVESRPDNRPQLADLRESGAIEQDADVVLLLFREEYYLRQAGRREGAEVDIPPDVQNKAEVIVAKQRNGPTGVVELNFFGDRVRFENRARHDVGAQPEEG